METSMDPDYKRMGQRVIVYPKFLNKLGSVLATGNVGIAMDANRDISYEKILQERASWHEQVCPILLTEDSIHLTNWRALSQNDQEWMDDAKRTPVAGYRQVLEAGPDVCDSESDAEYSDHGEKWSDSETYTSDMLNEKGEPDLGRARLTTEQASMQVAAAHAQAREKLMEISTRTPTPVPSDDDDENITENEKRAIRLAKKMSKSGNGRVGGQGTVQAPG
jgi:hypothetical protein